jgi:chemotaxis protein CheD
MTKESNRPVPGSYFLHPGFIYVSTRPMVISTVVGSCVAVYIYDRRRRSGGVNHFQFPFIHEKDQATARYGNVAIPALIHMMITDGSKLKYLEAQIFGGAFYPELSPENIGIENIKIARQTLTQKRIRIVSEDVGGKKGRKIVFNTSSNEIAVVKVNQLRKEDWYPYENGRQSGFS